MKSRLLAALLLVIALLAAGCPEGFDQFAPETAVREPSGGEDVAKPPPPPPPPGFREEASPPPPPVITQPADTGMGEASPPHVPYPPAEARAPAPAPVPVPGAPAQPSIRLSLGVALPQTGPEGTLMGFSVEYQFVGGRPDPSSLYVWVIERARGEPLRQPVLLRGRGTLQILVPGWRPEHGPFTTHLEDGRGNRLSPSLSLH